MSERKKARRADQSPRRAKIENVLAAMSTYVVDPNDEQAILVETSEGQVYRVKAELVGRGDSADTRH